MSVKEDVKSPAVSELATDTGSTTAVVDERQVPLSALEAERQKRQEKEQENVYLRELAEQLKAQNASMQKPAASDDTDQDLVNKRDLKNFKESLSKQELLQMKREISEDAFKEANPEAIRQINLHLKEIIDKKPWLAQSIEQASNRYSRAFEIVQDYMPMVMTKKTGSDDAKRIVENSKKPGSPVTVGKPANMSNADYLKSLRGTKEFKEYRKTALQGK